MSLKLRLINWGLRHVRGVVNALGCVSLALTAGGCAVLVVHAGFIYGALTCALFWLGNVVGAFARSLFRALGAVKVVDLKKDGAE